MPDHSAPLLDSAAVRSDALYAARDGARSAIFISHAAPEDNAFALWLGAKLAALGYEVWADVLSLRGGDDWQRKLEGALRHRAAKVLLAANPRAVDKQGVRNEIQIASDVARKIGDQEFIIPLRLAPFETPFLIAHAQYIDFERGWAVGLAELLGVLEETYKVPRQGTDESAIWREVQLIHGRTVSATPERLTSNWLAIEQLPSVLWFFGFRAGAEQSGQAGLINTPWPFAPFREGFLTFAGMEEVQKHFGPDLPLTQQGDRSVSDFLADGWATFEISRLDARNKFSDLARQALESALRARGLQAYALSSFHTAWWGPLDVAPRGKVAFRWADISGLRQIQGVSEKRRMNWHFGISVAARTAPIRHVRVIGRLIFTEDGRKPFDDVAKMHRLRRSFAKTWRNARWRDMLLAFLYWVTDGGEQWRVPVAGAAALVLRLPPVSWMAPIRMPLDAEAPEADDDDPSDDEGVDRDTEEGLESSSDAEDPEP